MIKTFYDSFKDAVRRSHFSQAWLRYTLSCFGHPDRLPLANIGALNNRNRIAGHVGAFYKAQNGILVPNNVGFWLQGLVAARNLQGLVHGVPGKGMQQLEGDHLGNRISLKLCRGLGF